jgi:glucose dehydrogenase
MGMTLFLLGLLISGSAAIVLALVILQHREANGALPFALVMIASAIWAWGYALQISAVSIPNLLCLPCGSGTLVFLPSQRAGSGLR